MLAAVAGFGLPVVVVVVVVARRPAALLRWQVTLSVVTVRPVAAGSADLLNDNNNGNFRLCSHLAKTSMKSISENKFFS